MSERATSERAMSDEAKRARELRAQRFAIAALGAGLGGALGYVLLRAWVHLRVGSGVPLMVLREARIGYYQALWVAAFLAIAAGLATWEAAREPSHAAALERAMGRAAIPLAVVIGAACFAWP